MKIYRKFKYFIFCLLIISCIDNSKRIENIICNNNIEYWDYNMIRDEQNVWFTFSFEKNGDVKKYSYNKKINKRWLFSDYPDPTASRKWKVTKDSVLKYLGSKEKITNITEDTIFTTELYGDYKKNKYIRVKGNLNIEPNDLKLDYR